MLNPADAGQLAEAFRLLQQGRAKDAFAIARKVAARAPRSADALHMLGLCNKAMDKPQRAIEAFEAARRIAPMDANLLGNYANLLCRIGRPADAVPLYRQMLALAPAHNDGWMNLGLALIDTGDAIEACTVLEHATRLFPRHTAAWQALAAARRASGDLAGAEAALRQAVQLEPGNGAAWTSLGVVRRLQGDADEALACYASGRQAGFAGPEIDDAEASAWLDNGDPARALGAARQLVRNHPGYVPGHALLAHLLWEHGETLAPGEEPRISFMKALNAEPLHSALRYEYIRFLLDANSVDEALQQIRTLRSQKDSPALIGMEANALSLSGEPGQAAGLFAAAHNAQRGDAGFLNLYVRHLLQQGEADAAAARALEALQSEPYNQSALAYLGLAWRLLGDTREEWLCGYDRLVAELGVTPPGDDAELFRQLEDVLVSLHTAANEPINQSVRGGTQTSGALFGRKDPVLVALRDAISRTVSSYIDALPADDKHPFLGRKAASFRYSGSWSVRLRSSGRHANHFHQQGWISSAYYVSLPPSVAAAADGDTRGSLQIGAPPEALGLSLEPRRIVRPRRGKLVLFPSYLWHGTLPFEDDEPRISIAFDVVPS